MQVKLIRQFHEQEMSDTSMLQHHVSIHESKPFETSPDHGAKFPVKKTIGVCTQNI